jgi:hypothetical protein
MRKELLLLAACGALGFSAFAVNSASLGNLSDLAIVRQDAAVNETSTLTSIHGTFKYRLHNLHRANDVEGIALEFTLDKAGDLAGLLGDNLLKVESLTLKGNVGADDFATMWKASFEGVLSEIDLSEATLANNEVPDKAFYHLDEQMIDGVFHNNELYKIKLPDNVERIGMEAFGFCMNLAEVNLPTSLSEIGREAFISCINIDAKSLTIPSKVTEIEEATFYDCRLNCPVTLPDGIKSIGASAFHQSGITEINLPEGLESIGESAFSLCKLKEVTIPSTCLTLTGSAHFWENLLLTEINLPEGLIAIPDRFASTCASLEKINIPSSVKKIGVRSFYCCEKLKSLELPEGLEEVGAEAFYYMTSLEEMIFPSSLKKLGAMSCMNWNGIKKVGCKAMVPPVCEPDPENPDRSPFGLPKVYDYNCEAGVPLYIPIGTLEAYTNAYGWNYFTVNIHESEDMIPASVEMTVADEDAASAKMYDLMGREISNPVRGQIYILNGKKHVWVR